MITPEQFTALSELNSGPRTERRRDGWQRWRGVCPCGSGEPCPWTGKNHAEQWVADHAERFHDPADEPPAEPECNCLVLLGADLVETSPLDCPLHKEPRSND